VKDFERDLYRFMETQYKPLADKIAKDKKFDAEIEKQVRAMIDVFKKTISYDEKKAEAAPAPVRPASASPTPAEPQSKEAGHR
jgi:hypothetical protein